MAKLLLVLVLVLAGAMALATENIDPPPLQPPHVPDQSLMLPMRDGVRIATDVYLPDGAGPWPVIYFVTPYGKDVLNPTTYLIDMVRALAFGIPASLPWLLSVAIVLVFAIIGVWLAFAVFQRTLQRS